MQARQLTRTQARTAPRAAERNGTITGSGISREALFVLAVCLLDMLSSAWLFHHGLATEANPLLRPFAEAGIVPFMWAKLLTFVPAVGAAEWYRRRRPEFVIPLLRWAGAGYVATYAYLIWWQQW